MQIKTSELTGAALDWAVAKAEGHEVTVDCFLKGVVVHPSITGFYPSRAWEQGGEIIEREGISTVLDKGEDHWQAVRNAESGSLFGPGLCGDNSQTGPTPLIAAMRCYVASKLGDTIEIAENLT